MYSMYIVYLYVLYRYRYMYMCISVYTVYRYLVSRYVYSVSKYIQIQSAGADSRQMIKVETRYTDRQQMRAAHSQD